MMSAILQNVYSRAVIMTALIFVALNAFLPLNFSLQAEATKYPFKLVITLEKTVFKLGEPVNVTCILTNISEENVTLYNSRDDPPDFSIRDENFNHVFRYRSYVGVAMIIHPIATIAPGDNITVTDKWKQIFDGTYIPTEFRLDHVPPGTYYVKGIFTSYTYGLTFATPVIRISILGG